MLFWKREAKREKDARKIAQANIDKLSDRLSVLNRTLLLVTDDIKDARRAFDRVQASGEILFDDVIAARDRFVAAMRGKDATFIRYFTGGGGLNKGWSRQIQRPDSRT